MHICSWRRIGYPFTVLSSSTISNKTSIEGEMAMIFHFAILLSISMHEFVVVDEGVEVAAGRELPSKGAVDLVLEASLQHQVHMSLQLREIVRIRLPRRYEEDAVVRKAGVGSEVLTNNLLRLLRRQAHVPLRVLYLQVDLGPHSEEGHVVARHLLHQRQVRFGVAPGCDDDHQVEVLDAGEQNNGNTHTHTRIAVFISYHRNIAVCMQQSARTSARHMHRQRGRNQ
mmetsp:Transcript_43319/g.69737  ORF Transcript_43319/g.69737 Transcript_43319/m.69737 type:complete len:227 (-) Transcript_43319:1287-1967(-)